MSVPKIIHQTIRSKRGLHPAFKDNIAALQARNPGWEHRLYDDHDIQHFLRTNYPPETLQLFERLNPSYGPALADFFRYHLMFLEGGVYLDIKSTAVVPLDEVLGADETYLLSHWSDGVRGRHPGLGQLGEYQQWFIACAPRHAFLEAVIERVAANIRTYTPARFGVGKLGVLRVTGPIAYTLAIREIVEQHAHRLVDVETLGFKYSIVETNTNKLAHERLFPYHYKQSREPIVLPGQLRGKAAPARPKLAGRNDPCPCGSGRKYKHCHGAA